MCNFNVVFCIRSQLTVIVSNIIKYDYPHKWPGVIDKISLHMQADNHRAWMGSLLTLYQLVKNYEYAFVSCYAYNMIQLVLFSKFRNVVK